MFYYNPIPICTHAHNKINLYTRSNRRLIISYAKQNNYKNKTYRNSCEKYVWSAALKQMSPFGGHIQQGNGNKPKKIQLEEDEMRKRRSHSNVVSLQ